MATCLYVLWHVESIKRAGLGDRRLVGMLFFIILAISLSGASQSGIQDRIAPMFTGIILFVLYVASRVIGNDIVKPLAIGAAIASIGVIVQAVITPGHVTGGLVFEQNYDIVIGYILLGVALYSGKWRLPLIALALVAVFLTGSPEGLVGLAGLGLMVVIKRDYSMNLVKVIIPVIITAIVWFSLGNGTQLYTYTCDIIKGEKTVTYQYDEYGNYVRGGDDALYNPIEDRLNVIKEEMTDIQPLGKGYTLTAFRTNTVHNVPLILVQQLGFPGILAGMAWLAICVYGMLKSERKYFWVIMFSLSIFDHYTWTQLAPYWWVGLGLNQTGDLLNATVKDG